MRAHTQYQTRPDQGNDYDNGSRVNETECRIGIISARSQSLHIMCINESDYPHPPTTTTMRRDGASVNEETFKE